MFISEIDVLFWLSSCTTDVCSHSSGAIFLENSNVRFEGTFITTSNHATGEGGGESIRLRSTRKACANIVDMFPHSKVTLQTCYTVGKLAWAGDPCSANVLSSWTRPSRDSIMVQWAPPVKAGVVRANHTCYVQYFLTWGKSPSDTIE